MHLFQAKSWLRVSTVDCYGAVWIKCINSAPAKERNVPNAIYASQPREQNRIIVMRRPV